MVKQNSNKLALRLTILVLVGFFALAYFVTAGNKNNVGQYKQDDTQQAIFNSKYLKFSMILPGNFFANDETSRVVISSPNGQLYVNRNGTQYRDLSNYLDNFDERTNLIVADEEELNIDDNDAVMRIYESTDVAQNQEKIYFIYAENNVYKISTTDKELFDDLERVAKSFRYAP